MSVAIGYTNEEINSVPEGANMAMMLPLVLFELALGFYLAIFGAREGVS